MSSGTRGSALRSDKAAPDGPLLERVAWYALLAVPVVVPIVVSKVPFTGLPPLTYTLVVYPKLFALGWLVGVSLIAWVLGVLSGAIETRAVPLWPLLAVFFGLGAVSTLFGLAPMTAFFGGDYYAVGLLVLLLGGALYLLVTQLVTGVRRMQPFSWATVAGGAIVAAVGLLQVIGLDPLGATSLPEFMNARGTSLLGNPDFTGNYLVVPAVMAAALALSESSARRRVIAACAFVLSASALIATLTRGAWIALVVGLVVLAIAYVRSGAKTVRWVSAASAAVAAVAIPLLLILRAPQRAVNQIADISGGATAGSGRLILWREALAIIAKHPLLGTGPDSYQLGWYTVRTAADVRLRGLAALSQDPHNVLLLVAATVGVPAALALVGFVVASLWRSARAVFAEGAGGGGRLLYAGWWAALLALSVALVFATSTTPVVVLLFSTTGVLMAGRAKAHEWSSPARWSVAVAGLTLALAAFYIATTTIAADAVMMQAALSPNGAALAARAATIAPWDARARQKAAVDYADGVVAAIRSGGPTAVTPAAAETAEAGLRALVASNPREYAYHVRLASFLDNAAPVLGPDAYRRAVFAADSALEIYPVSAEAAYLKALALLQMGDGSAAVRTLAPLWDVDPTYPNAGVVYAEALQQSGDATKARAVADALAKRFPDDQDVQELAAKLKSGSAK